METTRLRQSAYLAKHGAELYFVSFSISGNDSQWVRQMWCGRSEMMSLVKEAFENNCSDIRVTSERDLDRIIEFDSEDNDRPITLREHFYGSKYQEMHEYFSLAFEQESSERRAVPI